MTTPTQTPQPARPNTPSRRCTATCANGAPCRAWAVRGSDPPRCAPHGGGRAPACAPRGNQNARTHGFYATQDRPARPPGECTIDNVIAGLYRRLLLLSCFIDERMYDLPPSKVAHFHGLHGQHCSRLGRLLRDRDALAAGRSAEMDSIIAQALDELGEEWGTDLT